MNITGHDLIMACSAIGAGLAVIARWEGAVAKSPLPPALQKIQPRESSVPSRFGQVIPPFKDRR